MTVAPPAQAERRYDLNFARWVRANVNGGEKMSMCMQCGMCSGSCPIGTEMSPSFPDSDRPGAGVDVRRTSVGGA